MAAAGRGAAAECHRRAAVREPERRSVQQLSRRRHRGGTPAPTREDSRIARRGAHLCFRLQGKGPGRRGDRAAAGRQLRRRGQRQAPGRPRAGECNPGRRRERRQPLVEFLRNARGRLLCGRERNRRPGHRRAATGPRDGRGVARVGGPERQQRRARLLPAGTLLPASAAQREVA